MVGWWRDNNVKVDIGRYELRPSGLKGTWSEGIRYLKDGIRYLDRSKIAMDYLDRSKIGATQIRWHLESSFSCMNYRSDDGKTSVSVGFYSCLGRLQSLDLSRMEFALGTWRIPVLNVSLERSVWSTFSGSLWETPLGKRSSNLFMLGVFGYSERATSSWVFQKQFWRCWFEFRTKSDVSIEICQFFCR